MTNAVRIWPSIAKLALAALVLPACHDGSGGGGGTPPGPQVAGVTPADAATGVPRGTVVYVYFDRPVNGVSGSTVTLTGGASNPATLVIHDMVCNAAVIVPLAALDATTPYTVSLTGGITDAGGAPLAPQMFTFQTSGNADGTRPDFTGTPAGSNVTATGVDLSWSAGSDPGGDPPASLVYDIYVSTTGCFRFDLPAFDTTAAGQVARTLTGLTPNTPYQFLVRTRDTAGNRSGNTSPASQMTDLSFAVNVWSPIISARCAGCHPGNLAPFNLFPDAATAYGNLVNVASFCNPALDRVEPGLSGNSVLFDKVDTSTSTQCGSPMPLGRPSLPLSEQTLIRDWIDQGAHP